MVDYDPYFFMVCLHSGLHLINALYIRDSDVILKLNEHFDVFRTWLLF